MEFWHNEFMENDFAAVVQKYFLYIFLGLALVGLIGAIILLIASI